MTAMISHSDVTSRTTEILARLGVGDPFTADGDLSCRTPITGVSDTARQSVLRALDDFRSVHARECSTNSPPVWWRRVCARILG